MNVCIIPMCGSASTRNYFQHVNDSTKRSCCLQFLAFLGAKEPLAIASFRYHLDCELFPRVAATMTSKKVVKKCQHNSYLYIIDCKDIFFTIRSTIHENTALY